MIMKICAIICEYNPFHKGHQKHIEEAKKLSNADAIMCIMSGNFTQRGEPAIIGKYMRSRMAIECGADIVVQIPTAYACSTAEIFATAGVKIANSFDQVTHLAFGCETEDTSLLQKIAKYLVEEPDCYQEKLKQYLKEGNSLPYSMEHAMIDLHEEKQLPFKDIEKIKHILEKPNNILALEYLKALKRINSRIKPVFITRQGDYHSTALIGDDTSALAIRTKLYNTGSVRSVKKYVPKNIYPLLKSEITYFGLPNKELFSDLSLYVLKTKSPEEYRKVFDVREGIENRFIECSKHHKDLNEFLLEVKTKRYTYASLKRIILSLLLGIEKSDVESIKTLDVLPFVKVIAYKANRTDLLKAVSANTNIILRVNNVEKDIKGLYKRLIDIEDKANQIYALLQNKDAIIPNIAPDIYTKTIKVK